MMEEWLKYSLFYRKHRYSYPKDNNSYVIGKDIITYSETVLKEYGNLTPANEGIVYWAGKKNGNAYIINSVIAPDAESSEGRVSVSPQSHIKYIQHLSENKIVHIAQLHSHPDRSVWHSFGDDEWAAFKKNGLLSLVVPRYGQIGMMPIESCGIHRFEKKKFIRLSKKYVNRHFSIDSMEQVKFLDLRNNDDHR